MTQKKFNKRYIERTCIACREKADKRELTRLVRIPEGSIKIDPDGRMAGRGAYVCHSRGCWENAIKGNLILRSLKVEIDADTKEKIISITRAIGQG
jgi:predicted RNA-binding protein YlxR (DUF448 family)